MEKGIFRSISGFWVLVGFFTFSSCATFFDLGSEVGSEDYDRGYSAQTDQEDEAECDDDACNTKTDFSAQRSLAQETVSPDIRRQRAIETRDVILGMTRRDVLESWGEPSQREVAGRGAHGHERWVYGSRFNFKGSRTVIFENGRVAGWNR